MDAWASNRDHDVTLATRDGYLLMAEALREWDSPCAYSDADAFVLQPGEEAMIPARWSGKIPQQDFVCEPWPSLDEGLEVLPGLCAGGEAELMMCLANRAEAPVTVEPGLSLASARLPEEGVEYHRLGPDLLTGRPGGKVLEHEGALMEVWGTLSASWARKKSSRWPMILHRGSESRVYRSGAPTSKAEVVPGCPPRLGRRSQAGVSVVLLAGRRNGQEPGPTTFRGSPSPLLSRPTMGEPVCAVSGPWGTRLPHGQARRKEVWYQCPRSRTRYATSSRMKSR